MFFFWLVVVRGEYLDGGEDSSEKQTRQWSPHRASFLTLYLTDVAPPELQGAQPVLSVVLQPFQTPASVLSPLSPVAEILSLQRALISGHMIHKKWLKGGKTMTFLSHLRRISWWLIHVPEEVPTSLLVFLSWTWPALWRAAPLADSSRCRPVAWLCSRRTSHYSRNRTFLWSCFCVCCRWWRTSCGTGGSRSWGAGKAGGCWGCAPWYQCWTLQGGKKNTFRMHKYLRVLL